MKIQVKSVDWGRLKELPGGEGIKDFGQPPFCGKYFRIGEGGVKKSTFSRISGGLNNHLA